MDYSSPTPQYLVRAGSTFTLRGCFFTPAASYTVTWPNLVVPGGTVPADGSVQVLGTVPANSVRASQMVTVTDGTRTASIPVLIYNAQVAASATAVNAGGSVTFTGTGFGPGTAIQSASASRGASMGVTYFTTPVPVDASGAFQLIWSVPADLAPGSYKTSFYASDGETLPEGPTIAVYAPGEALPTPTPTPTPTPGTIIPGGIIATSATWTAAGNPYRVQGTLLVAQGVTLTVQPGVEVRFDASASLNVDGALVAEGTVAQPITFTSNLRPFRNEWSGIRISGSGKLENYVIEYASAGLTLAGPDNTQAATQCQFRNNLRGLLLRNARPVLAANRFQDNLWAVTNENPSTPVDARAQWWGHRSGPYHPNLNPTGLGDRVSDGVNFDPWLTGGNTPPAPRPLWPPDGSLVREPPVVLKVAAADPDEGERLYFRVEIISNTQVVALYDQWANPEGWDRAYYSSGMTATLTLRALPDGAYTWRVYAFDGVRWKASTEVRSLEMRLPLALASVEPQELIATPNLTQTLLLTGNFNPGLRVWLEQGGRRLDPVGVEVQSSTQASVAVDLGGLSGPWDLVVSQSGVAQRVRIYVFPYLPIISLSYRNPMALQPGRYTGHQMLLQNFGTAPAVALLAVVVPPETSFFTTTLGASYLGEPTPGLHLLAQRVDPGRANWLSFTVRVLWQNVLPVRPNPPESPEPGKHYLGDRVPFVYHLLAQPTLEAWRVIGENSSRLEDRVADAYYASQFMGGHAMDQYRNLPQDLAVQYLERLGAPYPYLADMLVSDRLAEVQLDLLCRTGMDTSACGSLPAQQASEGGGQRTATQTGVWDAVRGHVVNTWTAWKMAFTEGHSPVQSPETATFLAGELQALTEAQTFGLVSFGYGGETMAKNLNVDPKLLQAGRQTGAVLSVFEPNAAVEGGSKLVGRVVRRLHESGSIPLRQPEYFVRDGALMKRTLGDPTEPIRYGESRIVDGIDYNEWHVGIGEKGPHAAFGSTQQPVTRPVLDPVTGFPRVDP